MGKLGGGETKIIGVEMVNFVNHPVYVTIMEIFVIQLIYKYSLIQSDGLYKSSIICHPIFTYVLQQIK